MAPSVHLDSSAPVTGRPATRTLIELTREQCLQRLAGAAFGRVAVSGTGVAPVIRPVNYRFDERSQSIIFRTREGSKFHALLSSVQAAFEIDEIDVSTRRGWSVIVTGVTEEITDPGELKRLSALGVEPWASGAVERWIRIRARSVSGRSIGEL